MVLIPIVMCGINLWPYRTMCETHRFPRCPFVALLDVVFLAHSIA